MPDQERRPVTNPDREVPRSRTTDGDARGPRGDLRTPLPEGRTVGRMPGDDAPAGSDVRLEPQPSLPDLLRRLSSEGADLVRQEVALARAEVNEKVGVFQRNLLALGAGGALMLAGLLFALWALNTGVVAALVQVMDPDIAIWLSPLILALVLLGAGWGLIAKGKNAIAEEGLMPDETRGSLEEDGRWARRKAEHIKEEVTG
jgi:uncharacterized membrane protein YqjE